MTYVADDFALIAERLHELHKPEPTRCTCTSNGRWVYMTTVTGGLVATLLPDPNCALHGAIARAR